MQRKPPVAKSTIAKRGRIILWPVKKVKKGVVKLAKSSIRVKKATLPTKREDANIIKGDNNIKYRALNQ